MRPPTKGVGEEHLWLPETGGYVAIVLGRPSARLRMVDHALPEDSSEEMFSSQDLFLCGRGLGSQTFFGNGRLIRQGHGVVYFCQSLLSRGTAMRGSIGV